MIVVQLAAIVARLETLTLEQRRTLFPNGLSAQAVFLIWCDNRSAKKWANHLATKSLMGQRLLCLLGDMLRKFNVGIDCHCIPTDRNVIADFISRPHPALVPPAIRLQQMFAKHPFLRSCEVFPPSASLLSTMRSCLFVETVRARGELPQNLGRFASIESTTAWFSILWTCWTTLSAGT